MRKGPPNGGAICRKQIHLIHRSLRAMHHECRRSSLFFGADQSFHIKPVQGRITRRRERIGQRPEHPDIGPDCQHKHMPYMVHGSPVLAFSRCCVL